MTYRTSSPTVKCEKCEERLTDFEAYENHMAHMHGSSPSEESVVDWTLITDEDIITKDGNKYRVGGESINWSPNFDKEAREFLESKYKKDKIEILSKKKIGEAKKFVKALEFDTKQHYDKLLSKINGDSEYNKLYPNAQQRFPQNFEIGGKPFSQQRDQTSFQKINDWEIKDHGIEDSVDDPNAVMGSQTKKFSKGKYHIDEPVAKEQFSTSFYGDYLGESIGTESIETEWNNATPEERKKFIINTHNGFVDGHEQDVLSDWSNVHEFTKSILEQKWQFAHDEFTKGQKDFFGLESKANEYSIKEEYDLQDVDGKWEMLSKAGLPLGSIPIGIYDQDKYDDLPQKSKDALQKRFGTDGGFGESKANEYEEDEYDEETGELLTPSGYDEDEWIDDSDVPKSGHYESIANEDDYQHDFDELTSLAQDKIEDGGISQDTWDGSSKEERKDIESELHGDESWTFTNKHGVDYELDDEDGGLYNDLYYQQIDDGDEQEVFELLDRYNENYPYASKKDMENEIERTIGWVSDNRDIQTLVLQWEDSRYS